MTSERARLDKETKQSNELNTKCELLKQQNEDKAREIKNLKAQLEEMTSKFNQMNEAFNKVDKENLKNKMGKEEFEKELQASKAENKDLTSKNKKLHEEQLESATEIEKLKA